jgi:hypothetical protein
MLPLDVCMAITIQILVAAVAASHHFLWSSFWEYFSPRSESALILKPLAVMVQSKRWFRLSVGQASFQPHLLATLVCAYRLKSIC